MHLRRKLPLWISPVLGVILGVTYAYMFIHGLVVTWHFIGKPSENIVRIIGFAGGPNLYVETNSGNIYSIEYYNYLNGNDFLPLPIKWKKEEKNYIQPYPERKPLMKFVSFPLLVKVKQLYVMQFPEIEGEYLVKFALSEDGNLWMWNYGQGGMAVITYFIFPVMGFLGGSILALLIKVFVLLSRRYSILTSSN